MGKSVLVVLWLRERLKCAFEHLLVELDMWLSGSLTKPPQLAGLGRLQLSPEADISLDDVSVLSSFSQIANYIRLEEA